MNLPNVPCKSPASHTSPRLSLSPPLCRATLASSPCRVTSRTAAGECAVPIDACVPRPRRACPSLRPRAALPSPPPRAVSLHVLQRVSLPCRSTFASPALAAPAPLPAPVPRFPHLLPFPCHFLHCSPCVCRAVRRLRAAPSPRLSLSPPLCSATLTSSPCRVTSCIAARACAVPIDARVPRPRRACPSLRPCAALPSPPPHAVSLHALQLVSVPCRSTPACPALAAPAPLSAPVPRYPHLLPVPCHFITHCSG